MIPHGLTRNAYNALRRAWWASSPKRRSDDRNKAAKRRRNRYQRERYARLGRRG